MRKILQLVIAIALGLLAAAPVAASQGASVVTLSGTLTTVHEDALGTFRETDQYFLTVGAERYELQFANGAIDGQNGAQVTVSGRLTGHTLHVDSAKNSLRVRRQAPVSMVTTSGSTATTSGPRTMSAATAGSPAHASIAIVLINFTNLATKPFTAADAADALYGATGSAKAFYEQESKGRMTISGAAFGWFTIPATTTGCNWLNWVTLGTNAANAAGANLSSYTNVVFAFPQTNDCGWAGLGYVPGPTSLLNGTLSVQVMTHELGHNFGLGHANAISCSVNGVRVALSTAANCKEVAYADPFSTMGNNALRHNQGSQLGELGWLADSEKVIGTVGSTYTISSYFSSGPVKLVRVPRGDGSYLDLDVRSTFGFDNFAAGSPAVSGVTIRLGWGTASPTNSPKATQLIDTTPGTDSLADAPLLVGRTFSDPVSKLSISALSISSAGVVVQVREGIAPTSPTGLTGSAASNGASVALSWGAATDNVAVTGYRISRNGTTLATLSAAARAYSDATTVGNTAYTYAVRAIDGSGNASTPAVIAVTTPVDANTAPAPTATPTPAPTSSPVPQPAPSGPDTQAPTMPQTLTATSGVATVGLAWGAAKDNVGVASYVISRNGKLLGKVTGLVLHDAGLAANTAYTYRVAALDAAGHQGPAAQVIVTTKIDTVAPSTPRSFHKVRQSGRYVTFAWTKSTDNAKVAKYAIYKVGSAKAVAATTRTTIRLRTTRGATYYVRAIDPSGNRSGRSATVRIRW